MTYYNRDNIFNFQPIVRGPAGQQGPAGSSGNSNESVSTIIGITGVYIKNLLLDEFKNYKNVNATIVTKNLSLNIPERQIGTTYQNRVDFIINKQDGTTVSGNTIFRTWIPFLKKEYKLSSQTNPNWTQAKQNGIIRLNDQNLMYVGDLKGEWQENTFYDVGDLVYVRSGYPSFMGMPSGQTQTFVFYNTIAHTSSSTNPGYTNFFRTDDNYKDNNGIGVFPRVGGTATNYFWQIVRKSNSACDQWWFWDHSSNSVSATLYTDEGFTLHYPNSGDTGNTLLLQLTTGNISGNPPHTLRQNNGIIVKIDNIDTLWISNWWKSSYVTSNNDGLTFPILPVLTFNNRRFIEDGNTDDKFLWIDYGLIKNDSPLNYYSSYTCHLPININMLPHSKLYISRPTSINNRNINVNNLSADLRDNNTLGNGNEDSTADTTNMYIFDHNQGCWWAIR